MTYKNNFVYIPNIFSPDNDGLNDEFYALVGCQDTTADCSGDAVTAIDMTIKNKKGKQVFKGNNSGWDGGSEAAGLYSYTVALHFLDGSTKTYNGQVCLFNVETDEMPCENYNNCRFANQFDGEGFNSNLLSGEVIMNCY